MTSETKPLVSLLGIDHIVLRCINLERMLAFYTAVLGYRLERQIEALGLYQLRAGEALIDLVVVGSELGGETIPEQTHANLDHVCLRVAETDLSVVCEQLDDLSVVHTEPARRYGAQGFGLSLYLNDPEGNRIELKSDISTEDIDATVTE